MAKPDRRGHRPTREAKSPAPRHEGGAPEESESTSRSRYAIHAVLLEDAHLGSGSGGLGVNALIARDRRDRPVIWASHLEGLLRSAAVSLHGRGAASELFGAPGGSRQPLVFTSLYWVRKDEAQREPAPSRIWRSTARASYDNRAPAGETLRVVEMVPKGTRFQGHVELPNKHLTTLERLLQEIAAVGHGRASGAGRIELCIEPLLPARPGRIVGNAGPRLLLLLRNRDPLCVAATATPGNLIPSEPFIPGRTLLGALANWLITDEQREAAALLLSEKISVSDALPLPHEASIPQAVLSSLEVLPAPLTLQSEKPASGAGGLPWWAKGDDLVTRRDSAAEKRKAGLEKEEEPRAKLKRPEADLFICRRGDGPWQAYRPEVRARLRNGRPDPGPPEPGQPEATAPSQLDPLLFAIEQIAEETCFLAELRGDPDALRELGEALRPVLTGKRWLRVGRAGAPVEVIAQEWVKGARDEQRHEAAAGDGSAYLTLTSDLLSRDDNLCWRTSIDREALQQDPSWPSKEIQVEPCLQEETAVHGFNGTARLWRLPAAGVRRGSVFRVAGPDVAKLIEAAAAGRWLGERTHEGFGRFRVDACLPGPLGSTRATDDHIEAREDDAEEARCATTRSWLSDPKKPREERCEVLAEPGRSGEDRRPSLSQWIDLVNELRAGDAEAIPRRQKPETAGAMSWLHPRAREILEKLKPLSPIAEQAAHADLFVRWLRTARKERS